MIAFENEQYLPCDLATIVSTRERKILPSYEAQLYHQLEMVVYPMHQGFYIGSGGGSFYVDSLNLLRALKGKSARGLSE